MTIARDCVSGGLKADIETIPSPVIKAGSIVLISGRSSALLNILTETFLDVLVSLPTPCQEKCSTWNINEHCFAT